MISKKNITQISLVLVLLGSGSLSFAQETKKVNLPKPYQTKSVKNYSKVLGWSKGNMPIAPADFTVTKFADKLINPRNIYVAANGDVFIAESNTEPKGAKKVAAKKSGADKSQRMEKSANRITMFRDTNKDGIYENRYTFLSGLKQPFGMTVWGNNFYVGNTDSLMRFPYKSGQTSIDIKTGKKIYSLPAGGYNNHWTRNLISGKNKIYISVGSGSNVAEHGMKNEIMRANIIEINPDGTSPKVYASGLRNPVGMDFEPKTNMLWTVVNERDELGDELVPDYLTSVKPNGFYGWPYSYFGQHLDPRIKAKDQRMDLVKKSIVPEVDLGAHTASLGLTFYKGNSFTEKYRNGAFIGQHGSWNKSAPSGYKVVFVPFANGKPSGKPEDFLTGFIANIQKNEVYGRPVSLALLANGSLLVADDTGNTIWQVSKK